MTILLPREQLRPQAADGETVSISGSGTVLLVEDNPDVASVSASLLEQLGYTVRRASDADTACSKSNMTESIWFSPTS